MYGVSLTVQHAANRSTIEQNAEMATGGDGRDNALREYPEVSQRAVKAVIAGGGRRSAEEENRRPRASLSLAVETTSGLGGTDAIVGQGTRISVQDGRVTTNVEVNPLAIRLRQR